MYKTFEELERYAYMNNSTKLAKLYAKLDDDERAEHEFDELRQKLRDLEHDHDFLETVRKEQEAKIETLEMKLRDIQDVIDE